MDTSKAQEVTTKHIGRVKDLIFTFINNLSYRAEVHDASKFDPIELEPLARMQDLIEKEGQVPFGSDEYKRRTAMLGPMLEHHYANNRHHPEHFFNGVNGMNLIDIVEMFMDWKAASERGEEPTMSLGVACEKYNIEPQLREILFNTAAVFGFKTDVAATEPTHKKIKTLYAISEEEERWSASDPHEAARQYLDNCHPEELTDGSIHTIYEGELHVPTVETIAGYLGYSLADGLQENAHEICGEAAEYWLEKDGIQDKLNKDLANFLTHWCADNDETPNFGAIENIVSLEFRIDGDDGDGHIDYTFINHTASE